MHERLLLWDIDGTLLRAGPIGRAAFSTAIRHVLGTDPGDHGVVMGGKTDPQIALEILATMALVDSAAHEHLPAILQRLEAELAGAAALMRADGYVCPGVPEVLAAVADAGGATQSILTGNTAANAAAKLAAFALDPWFDLRVAAFGSDHADRCALVPLARERARRQGWDPQTVWVIGDTPHDLACARAGGARCLLVATGLHPLEELRGLDADAVVADLRATDDVAELLLG